MDYLIDLPFNPKPPTVMHIDLNSCFATIEQQADPRLRGKPVAVAAYKTGNGCILAPSIEAKHLGIKTGMRVKDGKLICPDLVVLEPDPWKYRNVHLSLKKLLLTYTDDIYPKSIDEFVLNLEGFPAYKKGMTAIGCEIKNRIKNEIGEWLTVSIGIAPNRFLAKTASGLKKPDGLEVIDISNYQKIFARLSLDDLCGIKTNNVARLNIQGIFSVLDFCNASPIKLQTAFHAVTGYYWYLRLRGWEIDDVETKRGSYGNSVALGEKLAAPKELAPVLMKLVEKMSFRMRRAGYFARGVHLSLLYKSGGHWHKGVTVGEHVFVPSDIYRIAYKLLVQSPYKTPVHTIMISCFDLKKQKHLQLNMLSQVDKKASLTCALDKINEKWGNFIILPARMLETCNIVHDRIAFGGIKELEEIVLS